MLKVGVQRSLSIIRIYFLLFQHTYREYQNGIHKILHLDLLKYIPVGFDIFKTLFGDNLYIIHSCNLSFIFCAIIFSVLLLLVPILQDIPMMIAYLPLGHLQYIMYVYTFLDTQYLYKSPLPSLTHTFCLSVCSRWRNSYFRSSYDINV